MTTYELWIPGTPKVKERPRMGGRRRVYTPEKTLIEEGRIAQAWRDAELPTLEGTVYLWADYYPQGQMIHVEQVDWTSSLRGDVDNYLKLTLDGLQGVAFGNDKRVVALHGVKHPKGSEPE